MDYTFQVELKNPHGLHARPAGQWTRLCQSIAGEVKVTKSGITVDGKSLLGLLRLGAQCGESLEISVTDVDDEAFNTFKVAMESLVLSFDQ